MNLIVIGYLRVSSKGQIDGDGFDRQESSIQRFCDDNKLILNSWSKEEGVSGTVEAVRRPALANLFELHDRATAINPNHPPFRAIVVERMDRLARDLMVSEVLLRECRERGIKVFSADHGLVDLCSNDGDPTRVLIRQIMGSLAQWEKSMLCAKLKQSRDRIKAKTGRCEGAKPYGFYPKEKEVFLTIKACVEAGYSLDRITNLLNEGGCRTRCGGIWHKPTLSRIVNTIKRKGVPMN